MKGFNMDGIGENRESWLKEIDDVAYTGPVSQRDLNDIERLRWDYISKLAQQQAAEMDLVIAEAYAAHGKRQGTLQESELDEDERRAINQARNNLELTQAKAKVLMVMMRKACGMPFYAKLRGFKWYDETSGGKPVPFIAE